MRGKQEHVAPLVDLRAHCCQNPHAPVLHYLAAQTFAKGGKLHLLIQLQSNLRLLHLVKRNATRPTSPPPLVQLLLILETCLALHQLNQDQKYQVAVLFNRDFPVKENLFLFITSLLPVTSPPLQEKLSLRRISTTHQMLSGMM